MAAIPFAGAVRARGVVARWGRAVVVVVGVVLVVVVVGPLEYGVGVAGMAHGPLVGFPVPLVGVGGWASPRGCTMWWAGGGSGAGLDGDGGRGVPRPWVRLAGGGGGLWGMDDRALGDGDADEGLDGVVLGGRLCGGGGCSGAGCGGWGVLAWVRVRVGVVSVGFVVAKRWCVCSRGRTWGRVWGWGPVPG